MNRKFGLITFNVSFRYGEDGINSFEGPGIRDQKIDYIFTNLPCDISRTATIRDEKDGLPLSDHYPVGAWLEL